MNMKMKKITVCMMMKRKILPFKWTVRMNIVSVSVDWKRGPALSFAN